LSKKRQFFANFFGDNNFKIITSVPGRFLNWVQVENLQVANLIGINLSTSSATWTWFKNRPLWSPWRGICCWRMQTDHPVNPVFRATRHPPIVRDLCSGSCVGSVAAIFFSSRLEKNAQSKRVRIHKHVITYDRKSKLLQTKQCVQICLQHCQISFGIQILLFM
jgi:hypothetical protein